MDVSGSQQIGDSARRSASWGLPDRPRPRDVGKVQIGESLKIIDPETKAPAIKNPFLRPKPGVPLLDDFAIDRLLVRGVVFGACNIACKFRARC
jgi:hypothetical protein